MQILTKTDSLAAFCQLAQNEAYVAIDTEFLRERTYYPQLCLVQLALPGSGPDRAAIVDPLAEGLSLEPLFELLRAPRTVKVFHAARQDLEIFWVLGAVIPEPLFDTQLAAMVLGYGDQVAYETLVKKIARVTLDKTSRFTDWSQRPLSAAQLAYALADVTHLRVIYEVLAERLAESGRASWLAEEMAALTDPATYVIKPEEAWLRIKTRGNGGRFLTVVRELARFREEFAQSRNVPRGRVLKDEALLELASLKPQTLDALERARLLPREARRGAIAEGILAAVKAALAVPAGALPAEPEEPPPLNVNPALADLLRVLLKARADEAGVAQRLIASAVDLDALAAGRRDLPCLQGWRAEIFGRDALRLCQGEIALAVEGNKVVTVERIRAG